MPTYEMPHWAAGRVVAGIDEVGRGPLAGPVVAAAVILPVDAVPDGLADSKVLTAARRTALDQVIRACGHIGLGMASVDEIDAINILQATYLAMRRAVAALPLSPAHLLIDGNRLPPDLPCEATTIVQGDGCCPSIAAASIVAKCWRDAHMCDLAQHFPGYGWETNAGYGSKSHREALRNLGVTPHHRRSFRPVHDILYQEETATG
ncbi:RNase HII [Citreimonas salinaria]|uniref:Ribonuclease HII n=2 Tax=Citreimonas salinaria TaxID=321339 RepID=A0A1H3I366_9RHOB|nr:RNase HII [Citreimonas salinaria]